MSYFFDNIFPHLFTWSFVLGFFLIGSLLILTLELLAILAGIVFILMSFYFAHVYVIALRRKIL